MNKWVLPPNEVTFDLQVGNSSNPLTNPPPVPYAVSNSVHGGEGELLFYIVENQIYDSDGINVGQLNNATGPNGNTYFSSPNPLSEIVIFPVPDRCNQYCAITFNYQSYGSALTMTEITINNNGDVIVQQSINGGLDFFSSDDDGGLALSKPINGTYADRFLYVVKDYQLIRYTISNGGIGSKVILNNDIPVEETLSLELSYDETFLAYGNYLGKQIYTIDLTDPAFPVTTYVVASLGLPLQGIIDVEIDQSGKFIYFSCWGTDSNPNKDIYQLNLDGGNVMALNASFKVDQTQLELAKDGLIYFVNADDKLCYIDPDLSTPIPTISPLGILVESDVLLNLGFSFHTLPDQIDGQDYNEFSGTEEINITELSLGGFDLPQTFPAGGVGLPELFNCGPIPLDLTYTGDPLQMTFEVYSTNAINGTPINTNCDSPNPDLVCFYASDDITSFPNNFFDDIRCLSNMTACDLFTGSIAAGNTTFRLKVTYSNRCESVSKIGHFRVSDTPTSPVTVLGINAGNGATTCSASQDINNPCLGGTFSANIDLSSSTGGITFYELTVSQIDCATGNIEQVLFPTTSFSISNPGTIGLNSLEIQGNTGFFANNSSNWVNRCLKIEATVGNNCGSTTAFSYFRFDGQYYTAPDDKNFTVLNDNSFKEEKNITKDNSIDYSASFFPNPFTDQINFDLNIEENTYTFLRIFDSQGQSRKLVEQELTKGKHSMQIDFSQYPSGIYYYQLSLGDTVKTGKLIKVQ